MPRLVERRAACRSAHRRARYPRNIDLAREKSRHDDARPDLDPLYFQVLLRKQTGAHTDIKRQIAKVFSGKRYTQELCPRGSRGKKNGQNN